jgi:hypothetical protein
MLVKLHKNQEGRTVAAVCDTELSGKKFEEGEAQLDLASEFYKGEETDGLHAGDIMRNSDIVNLVGEKSVQCGISEGVIEEGHVKKIAGIPYAQAVIVHE